MRADCSAVERVEWMVVRWVGLMAVHWVCERVDLSVGLKVV